MKCVQTVYAFLRLLFSMHMRTRKDCSDEGFEMKGRRF